MKIGLSFSRCVLDIVEGRVDFNDVLVVISRTDFDPRDDEQWYPVWKGYTHGGTLSKREWAAYDVNNAEHEKAFRAVAINLLTQGKLHQPRQFGAHPYRLDYYWLEAIIPPEEYSDNPALKSAWDNLLLVAGLNNINAAHLAYME